MRPAAIALAAALVLTGAVTAVALLAGRDLVVHTALRIASDEYTVADISGALTGELQLRGLDVSIAGNRLRADRLAVDVAWRALLAGRPGLDRLLLHNAEIDPAPSEPASLSFELPALPDAFVRALDLADVRVAGAGGPLVINRVRGGFDSRPQALTLNAIEAEVAGIRARASGRLPVASGTRGEVRLQLEQPAQSLTADARVSGSLQSPAVRVNLSGPGLEAVVEASTETGGPTLPIEVQRGNLRVNGILVEHLRGRFTIGGRDGPVHVAATLVAPELPHIEVELDGTLQDFDRFVGDVRASASGTRVAAAVDTSFEAQHLTAELRGNVPDAWQWLPGAVAEAALPLDLTARMDIQGFAEPHIELTSMRAGFRWSDRPGVLELHGTLGRGRPSVNASLSWAGRTSTATLADGRLSARMALADTGLLLPGSSGALSGTADVQLRDDLTPASAVASLRGDNLRFDTLAASRADLELDWRPGAPMKVHLALGDALAYAGAPPYAVQFDANGKSSAFDWTAVVNGTDMTATATGSTHMDADSGVADLLLTALDLNLPGVDRLLLEAPAAVSIGPGRRVTGEGCLRGQRGANVCVSAHAERIHVAIDQLTDSVWMPVLVATAAGWPAQLALAGTLSAEAEYHTADGHVTANASLVEGALLVADDAEGEDRLAIERLALSADGTLANPRRMNASVELQLAEVGSLNGRVALSGEDLNGRLELALPDLSPLALLAAQVDDLSGTAQGLVQLGGTLQAPRFDVDLAIAAEARIPALGIVLRDLQLNASGSSADAIAVTGEAATGDGQLHLTGAISNLTRAPAVRLEVTGQNALIANQPDLIAAVSPQLTLNWDDSGALVRGRVLVDRARVVAKPSFESSIVLSDDVVIHGSAESPAEAPLPVRADLRLALGSDTRVTAGPIDTAIGGELRLTMEPGRPRRLLGGVAISSGEYQLYGVKLEIQRGRLDFAGPLDNPAVQLRASRTLDNQVVGIDVSGFLQDLRTQLFSDPAQSEADTLSMLITGRSFADASRAGGTGNSTDLNRIGNAAASLGLGATGIVSRVRERVGLDDLTLSDPLDREQTAVMLGKQLTDRLYARYSYSLFNRTGGLLLRYQVLPNFSVQSEVGSVRTLDFIYSRQFR